MRSLFTCYYFHHESHDKRGQEVRQWRCPRLRRLKIQLNERAGVEWLRVEGWARSHQSPVCFAGSNCACGAEILPRCSLCRGFRDFPNTTEQLQFSFFISLLPSLSVQLTQRLFNRLNHRDVAATTATFRCNCRLICKMQNACDI